MTTRPKARRFRLRLGDDAATAARPAVAPQRDVTPRPATPARSGAATPRPQAPASGAAPNPGAAANPAAQTGRTSPDDALFDENEAPVRRPRSTATAEDSSRAAALRAAADGARSQRNPQYTMPDEDEAADTANEPTAARAPSGQGGEHGADIDGSPGVEAEIEAIRAEELTGRQLRMAMRVAQRNGIKATSGLEAVRLLRRQGIDPFEPSTLLDIVRDQSKTATGPELTTTEQPKLPKAYRQPPPPATTKTEPSPVDEARRRAEISQIQRDIARRRRRRMALLAARLLVFVGLPTAIVAYYFAVVATPLYATNSEFVIQQADSQAGGGAAGGLASMMGGSAMGSTQDSITVQSYLQSRDAMRRLNAEEGFKAYFQQPQIDPLRRLAPDATDEAAYRLYQDVVLVSFDPTEGIIRMEVVAADPETSERFARALVQYAEDQVDQLTARLRENQMSDAMGAVALAEQRFSEAQQRVLDLQERFQILSSEVEVTLLTEQIGNLEAQLTQERLALSDLEANARPNRARLEQAQRRIAAIEAQITEARSALTQGGEGGVSLARVQRELIMAESDVQTRQMLMAQAMQSQEAARLEANRQVRYLAVGVSPIAPDEATYPRVFENTSLAFLIFAGIYLMISMTSAILREQVTG